MLVGVEAIKHTVYKVQRIDDYRNEAADIDFDYSKDFERVKGIRGYVRIDYHISDEPNLGVGEVFCTGDSLIKIVGKACEFDGTPVHHVFEKMEEWKKYE